MPAWSVADESTAPTFSVTGTPCTAADGPEIVTCGALFTSVVGAAVVVGAWVVVGATVVRRAASTTSKSAVSVKASNVPVTT